MMERRYLIRGGAAVLFLLTFCLLGAEAVIDGIVSPGEYSGQRALDKGTLHWMVEEEDLVIAYAAPTEGWVALGFGGLKMDGTLLILGYEKDGTPAFSVERGRGRRHSPIDEEIDATVGVKETEEETVLEIRIPLSAFPGNGSGGSDHIIAFGRRDDFTSFHRFRDAQSLTH